MEAIIILTTVLGFIGQTKAASAQREAAGQARQLAEANAENIEAETAEAVRRAEADRRRRVGIAETDLWGSGFTLSGGMEDFLTDYNKVLVEEIDWMKISGKSQADIVRQGGVLSEIQGQAMATGTLGSAFAGLAPGVQAAGNIWSTYYSGGGAHSSALPAGATPNQSR